MLNHATKFAPRSENEFKLAYDAGYRNAEFWLNTDLIQEWKSIVTRASDYPMGYALHFPNRGELTQKHLENVIDLYYALNCSAVVIHQPMFEQYGQTLLEIDPSLRLGIENHNLPNKHALDDWLHESPCVTLDVEHLWIYTAKDGSLKKMLKLVDRVLDHHFDKLVHVHLPGYQPGYNIHRPQYCSRQMVFQVFTKLADAGYEGLIVSETVSKFQNAEELAMDVLLQKRWANRRNRQKTSATELHPTG